MKIYAPADFFSLGAPIKFPFRETEPDAAKSLPKDEQYFRGEKAVEGMVTVPTGRFWKNNVEYLTTAKEVLPGVTLIPTVSELMGTFIKYPPFEKNPQFIGMPELSLALATEKGEIIVSGCSHSTIETIVKETVKVRKGKIYLVAGGFHLIPYSREYIENLAKRMKEEYRRGIGCTGTLHRTTRLFRSSKRIRRQLQIFRTRRNAEIMIELCINRHHIYQARRMREDLIGGNYKKKRTAENHPLLQIESELSLRKQQVGIAGNKSVIGNRGITDGKQRAAACVGRVFRGQITSRS